MEDVPVKIVERYKPPPLVYQLPQSIANRLAQDSPKYLDGQAFQYDFQLERTVLSKCQHWRQMRHQQQQARNIRQEQRKQERQRALEAKQKEMLGAVEYPSAADFSSDSDDDKIAAESSTTTPSPTTTTSTATTTSKPQSINAAKSREQLEPKSINSCNNFHDILQPTILSGTTATPVESHHKRNSSLNYADFEYNMNSTPFDNIELKTINDLDILAQVLHQSQLTQSSQVSEEEENPKTQQEQQPENKQEDRVEQEEAPVELELAVTTLAETKATLDSVNFQMHCDDGQNIPTMYPTHISNTPQLLQNNYQHMVYNQHYYPQVSGQQQHQLYYNHNYLQHGYINGYGTPTHLPLTTAASNNSPSTTNVLLSPQEADTKSRSVPDILRELKTELQQAEKRRARLHSHNENERQVLALNLSQQELQAQTSNANIFQELTVPAQKLAQRISNMGFPLDRVAKVVSLCGVDDKR